MAKSGSAPAPAASAAPAAPAPAAPAPAASAPASSRGDAGPAQVQSRGEPLVIQWNNDTQDAPASGIQDAPVVDSPGEKPPGSDGAAAGSAKGEKDDDQAAGAEGDGRDAPKPGKAQPSVADRRERALDALDSERRARQLETRLQAEQTGRAADREQLQTLERAVKTGTLGDLLAARGISPDEALELLLQGGDAIAPTGKGPPAKLSPEQQRIADLEAQVADLAKGRKTEKETAEAQQITRALTETETITKDLDIPVTRAVEGGFELVLRTAWELWAADGKTGQIADYMPDAADRAEKHFRKERPRLAELADRARKASKQDAGNDGAAAAGASDDVAPAASIGRRAGGGPAPKAKTFWQRDASGNLPSREEIDDQIKRELNLRDKT